MQVFELTSVELGVLMDQKQRGWKMGVCFWRKGYGDT